MEQQQLLRDLFEKAAAVTSRINDIFEDLPPGTRQINKDFQELGERANELLMTIVRHLANE